MARTGREAIAKAMTTRTPRLVVLNSSTSDGRMRQMLRLRPSLVKRVRELTVGPIYIIIEVALEKLCQELEALEPGTLRTVDAATMDPTPEDAEAFDEVPKQRGGRRGKPVATKIRHDREGG